MGRATYDPALREGITSPYAHLRQYVVSTSITDSPDPTVEIVSGDPIDKVSELKTEVGRQRCGHPHLRQKITMSGCASPADHPRTLSPAEAECHDRHSGRNNRVVRG